MGRADYYADGDWNATCYQCGRKRKASELRKHWQGYWVCPEHWEPRHPQDFVRGVKDDPTPPFVQAPSDIDIQVCTINGSSGIPGYAIPGCMRPGQTTINPEEPLGEIPTACDIYGLTAIPSFAMPGCSLPDNDPFAP